MIIKQAIEMLNRYSPDDELCILWWDKPQFENMDGLVVFKKKFFNLVFKLLELMKLE